ncbi:hypothetical protein [uncultured Fibrella sp.]|uniref:hypothetical protein n=1 Tax=uncultured Fibrella sp. TaxID=1284596 RepID=UPI0035CAFAB9
MNNISQHNYYVNKEDSQVNSAKFYKLNLIEKWFFRQRLSYIIFTTLPGWILTFITEQTLIADISAIWASLVCLIWIWTRMGHSLEMIRLVRIGAATLCLLLNSSWLTASFVHQFSLNILIETSLQNEMNGGLAFSFYALAMVYITIFSCVLAFIGSTSAVFKLECKIYQLFTYLNNISINYLLFIATTIILGEFVLIYFGIIGQRALLVEGVDKGKLPDWYIIYDSLFTTQTIINSLILIHIWKNKRPLWANKVNYLILLVSFLLFMFISFTKGRRDISFGLIIHAYCIFLLLSLRPNLKKTILVICIAYPLLSQIMLFNNFMRSGIVYVDESKSALETIPDTWMRFQESESNIKEESKRTEENLATRPLVATPLALCLQLQDSKKSFMLGKNLLHAIIWTIPGPIFPNKTDYPTQEELLYKHFRIGSDDTADSLYLSAYTEFSWLGLLIYPALVVLLWMLVMQLIISLCRSELSLLIIFSVYLKLFTIGIGEEAVNAWTVALRLSLAWLVLDNILVLLNIKQERISVVAD